MNRDQTRNRAEYTTGCSTICCRMITFTFDLCLGSLRPDSLCLRSPELSVALHSAGCCLKIPRWSEGPESAEFDDPVLQKRNHHSNVNQSHPDRSRKPRKPLAHTSFSHSVSAFCRRRISISTWLRACFSLTSKAPLSVSLLVRISLQDPSSCSVLAHLRRQSSKFLAIWMKSKKQQGQTLMVQQTVRWDALSLRSRTIKYSLGSMLSFRRSICDLISSYKLWRFSTAISMMSSEWRPFKIHNIYDYFRITRAISQYRFGRLQRVTH